MTVSSLGRTVPVTAVGLGASLLIVLLSTAQTGQPGNVDWPVYRGDPKGNQYAALAQINATNVHKLRPAWEVHTGDASQRSTMYANPIVINGVMYISTPSLKAMAINAKNTTLARADAPCLKSGGGL